MARRLFGDMVIGQSGSVNKKMMGMTTQKNGVVRVRVIPVQPNTDIQQTSRAVFAYLTTAWSEELNEEERNGWETQRNDNPYYLKQDGITAVARKYGSAKDLFIAMNTNLIYSTLAEPFGEVQISAPGEPAGLDGLGAITVTADASAGTVEVAFAGTSNDENLQVFMTPPVSAGTMREASIKSKYSLVYYEPAGAVSPLSVSANYVAKFGPITLKAGQKIFYRIMGIDSGTGKARLVEGGSIIIVP